MAHSDNLKTAKIYLLSNFQPLWVKKYAKYEPKPGEVSCQNFLLIFFEISTFFVPVVGSDKNKDKNFTSLLPTLDIFVEKHLTTVLKTDRCTVPVTKSIRKTRKISTMGRFFKKCSTDSFHVRKVPNTFMTNI